MIKYVCQIWNCLAVHSKLTKSSLLYKQMRKWMHFLTCISHFVFVCLFPKEKKKLLLFLSSLIIFWKIKLGFMKDMTCSLKIWPFLTLYFVYLLCVIFSTYCLHHQKKTLLLCLFDGNLFRHTIDTIVFIFPLQKKNKKLFIQNIFLFKLVNRSVHFNFHLVKYQQTYKFEVIC